MEPDRSVVDGPGLPPAIGPYSQAVRAGILLFVSGQPGVDPKTGEVAGPGFGDEARQAFRNLETVLRAGGSRLDLVANTTVLVADVGDFAELNDLYAEHFPSDPPARTTLTVPSPRGLRISIGCVAVLAG
jgi:2-iminobutanoate/2-iminopropanoate deaminase